MAVDTLNTYAWVNPGGEENLRFIVIQVGNLMQIIDTSFDPYSDGVIYQEVLVSGQEGLRFSFTEVNDELVVATNTAEILIYTYEGGTISKRSGRLKIRDMFGVEDFFDGEDLTQGLGLMVRPATLSSNHLYNLRNQTFGIRRYGTTDTIRRMRLADGAYPSNADNVNYAMAPNPVAENDPQVDRFWIDQARYNLPGNFRAPMGFFVIDALERGGSRIDEIDKLSVLHPEYYYKTVDLPADTTSGGARYVAEYAGRAFYAGFSNKVLDGDSMSPKMGAYVLYSQLIRSDEDAFKCYQDGDPTSLEVPDLIDTDGGFIRISGVSNICSLINVGKGLMVFAENGVWMISGNGDDGFTANNQMTTKITDRGTKFPDTIVTVDNTVMYWSEDGIYHLRQNEFGDWGSSSLTEDTIQTFYEDIKTDSRRSCKGLYDSYDKKVRWVYNNYIGAEGPSMELVFDVQLGAFYPNEIETVDGFYPRVCSMVVSPPYKTTRVVSEVTYNGDVVYHQSDVVTVSSISAPLASVKEILYLTVYRSYEDGGVDYGFTTYSNEKFKDWEEVDGDGIDAEAILVTGYLSGGDFSRTKQVPYINFYLERTEDGFNEDSTGNLIPTNESSCIVQAQWSWNNSPSNGKWGNPFQAYRYRRLYSPSGPADNFDSGEALISTRNKLRGMGKVLSLKVATEPEKDLRLVGWSINMDVNTNV